MKAHRYKMITHNKEDMPDEELRELFYELNDAFLKVYMERVQGLSKTDALTAFMNSAIIFAAHAIENTSTNYDIPQFQLYTEFVSKTEMALQELNERRKDSRKLDS